MKNLVVSVFFVFLLMLVACESKRPQGSGQFAVTVEGRSILTEAAVTILKEEGNTTLAEGTTDAEGLFSIEGVSAVGTLRVKVCGGKFFSAAAQAPVAFNGCLSARFTVGEKSTATVFVDFVSTLTATYVSDTAQEDVFTYLALTGDSVAVEETTLTDATKRYLWQEAFTMVAGDIATANGVGIETSLSTETLWNLVLNDLSDNNVIDGSTGKTFGPALRVNEQVLRTLVPQALARVSTAFSTNDLADWAHHLAVTPAEFLAGGEKNDDDGLVTDTDTDESLYPDYDTVGNPPGIEIKSPANNAVVSGTVAVKAQRTLDSCPLLTVTCTVKNSDETFSKNLADTNAHPEVFEATLDTRAEEMSDGTYTVTCTGSNGVTTATKSVSITLSNHNPVTFLAYMPNKVTGIESVEVYNLSGTKVATFTEENGSVQGDLPPGDYTAKLTGGEYPSLLFSTGGSPKSIALSTTLRSRFSITPGSTTKVYFTPLTTLREVIYAALKAKGGRTDEEAIADSLSLLVNHFVDGLNPYAKPQLGQPAENGTITFIASAGFEQLAADIAREKKLSDGAVLADEILSILAADLVEANALFDGLDQNEDSLTIQGFSVDSYLFRYHYAVALKRFIETQTSFTYQDFQNLIYNSAMDTSELFPANKPPIAVVDKAPEIRSLAFKRPEETTFHTYEEPYGIPFVQSALDLRFSISLGESATLDAFSAFFEPESPLASIDDLVKNGDTYTLANILVAGPDGEKSLTLTANDNQNNYGQRLVRLVKDTVPPVVSVTPPQAEVVKGELTFDFEVTENYLAAESYTVTPQGGAPTVYSYEPPAFSGTISPELPGDGTYSITFTATDKAGNRGSATFTRTRDNTPPTATIMVQTLEETPRTLPTATKWVNANDFKILFSNVTDRPGSHLTYRYTVQSGATIQPISHQSTNSSWESTQYLVDLSESDKSNLLSTKHTITAWVTDEVGNASPSQSLEVYVDTVAPVLTVGDVPSNPVDAFTFTYTATDTNMDQVWLVDVVGTKTTTVTLVPGTAKQFLMDCNAGEGGHIVTFHARDLANNEAEPVQKTIYIDCTPPIFNNGSDPFAGTMIEKNYAFIKNNMGNIAVTLSEPATLSYLLLKDNLPTNCNGDLSYSGSGVLSISCPFASDGTDDGTYTLILFATDLAGNKSTEYRRTFTVDTLPPTFTRATTSKTVPWNPFTMPSNTTIQFTGADASLDHCDFFFNGTQIIAVGENTSFPGSLMTANTLDLWLKGMDPNDPRIKKNDFNQIKAICKDRSRNIAERTFQWWHDTKIPTITVTSTTPPIPSHGVLRTTPLTINLKITDNAIGPFSHASGSPLVSKVYCQWISSATTDWQYCSDGGSSGKTPTYQSSGNYYFVSFTVTGGTNDYLYSFRFFAKDTAGNIDEGSPEIVSYRFDNVAPIPRVLWGSGEYINSTNASYVVLLDTPLDDVVGLEARAIENGAIKGTATCSRGYLGIVGLSCTPGPFGMPLCIPQTEQRDDGYTCSFDNLPITFNGNIFFKAKDVYGNGDYDFGNTGACTYDSSTSCLARKLVVDAALPDVTVSVKEESRYVNGTKDLKAYVNVASSSAITAQKCSIAKMTTSGIPQQISTPFDCTNGEVSFSASLISLLSEGSYVVYVSAANAAGSAFSTSPFFVDKTAPSLNSFSPQIGDKQFYNPQDSINFSLNASDKLTGIKGILVLAIAGRFRWNDGTITSSGANVPLGVSSFPENTPNVSKMTGKVAINATGGEYYQLKVTVTDWAGNATERIFTCLLYTSPSPRDS